MHINENVYSSTYHKIDALVPYKIYISTDTLIWFQSDHRLLLPYNINISPKNAMVVHLQWGKSGERNDMYMGEGSGSSTPRMGDVAEVRQPGSAVALLVRVTLDTGGGR